ncbi:outer membrane protein assembly factor BamD [Enterobacteriaceae endosymbiont of Donacia tomentosa]|uniref:outer membrane protein assembly factor BamD n=1 Tax=Enterobacteriaceae endosymbiont of Donacia tomentosa TaxID=2675787 RepID=UPI0014492218|nr:outer membrane protein assembly factor BamD [Enterobacteriaceae endosymbiont of Donacia tomentosa]QJC31808.1 outer membrane protein assembly factor BamD [Enterobacteriaceae endosymbiont of Donacia tomentosa]
MKIFVTKKFFYINLLILIFMFTINCTNYTKEQSNYNSILQKKYSKAQAFLIKKKYKKALSKFEDFNKNYPYNHYTENTHVNLIYLNYKNKKFLTSLVLANDFIQTYNASPYTDYIYYIKIMSELSLDNNTLQNLLKINKNFCNPFYIQLAIDDMEILFKNFPKSRFIKILKPNSNYIKKRSMNFKLNIIKFLFKNNMYLLTIKKSLEFIKLYSNKTESNFVKVMLKQIIYKINFDTETNF